MGNIFIIEPTWKRLGFTSIPDKNTSGKDVGIVILDTIRSHSKIKHLGKHLRYILVNDDLSIESRYTAFEESEDFSSSHGEHGLMSLLLLSHLSFNYNGGVHTGIVPSANFIVLNHGAFRDGEGERLKRGIDWILERKLDWNIRIILCTGWNILDQGGWLESTRKKPTVYGLSAAIKAGLMVIAANGNTRYENELPPIEYLSVGGYIDRGSSDMNRHVPFLDEPWGRNGDGHMRPDVLAPRLYLPVPYCEEKETLEKVSFFGGTSGAATLVTGVCAHVLSLYPSLDLETLREVLIASGLPINGYDNKAPRVIAANVITAIAKGYKISKRPQCNVAIKLENPLISLHSNDPIKRGLALTILIKQGKFCRGDIWKHVMDPSQIVRKVAIWALQKPDSLAERDLFWKYLNKEDECGVRGFLLYGLLYDATKEEINSWISWITDINWSVRWCVSEYFKKFSEFPQLEKTHDLDLIEEKAAPMLKWYNKRMEKTDAY